MTDYPTHAPLGWPWTTEEYWNDREWWHKMNGFAHEERERGTEAEENRLDVQRYIDHLRETGREDLVPKESPTFTALEVAEMQGWSGHD